MEIINLIATFFVGVFVSFISTMVGSGGVISIPFLIFLGLPPQVAIATNNFGAAGKKIGAATKFWKTNYIQWKYFVPFSILSLVAAFAGANILLAIDKDLLSRIVALLLLIILPIILIKKDTGVVHHTVSKLKRAFGYVLYFLVQVFGAFVGGSSAFLMLLLMTFFGLTIVEASATTKLPSLFMTMAVLIIFGVNGILDYQFGVAIFSGMLVGGWLGAHTAIKKGNAWVKGLFLIIVVLSAIKLLVG